MVIPLQVQKRGYERWRHWHQGQRDAPVYVHRLLAVAEYGFDAVKNKEVHHKNGIPWDNRPENIKVVGIKQHRQIEANRRWGNKPWRDENILKELYINQDHSMKQVSNILDCTPPTVFRWLKKYNIEK